MAFARRVKKLYFDVELSGSATNATFLCTQGFTSICTGDRYGSLLTALESCTGSATTQIKQKNEVSAWFQPSRLILQNTTTPLGGFTVNFVQPTSTAANCGVAGTNLAVGVLPYLTVGNTSIGIKGGQSAVFSVTSGLTQHFGVRVSKIHLSGGTFTGGGVLYVQRQHSIEV